MGCVPGAHSSLLRITSDIRFKSPPVHLHWEMETRWSASRDCWAIWTAAMWKEETLIHAMCFGLAFILVKNRSIRLMAMKKTSDGRSYQTLRHLSTCAEPSRDPIVISSFCWREEKLWVNNLKHLVLLRIIYLVCLCYRRISKNLSFILLRTLYLL